MMKKLLTIILSVLMLLNTSMIYLYADENKTSEDVGDVLVEPDGSEIQESDYVLKKDNTNTSINGLSSLYGSYGGYTYMMYHGLTDENPLWPVLGLDVKYSYISRSYIWKCAGGNNPYHGALDITDCYGYTVRSAVSGTVVKLYKCSHNTYRWENSCPSCCNGFGTGVIIQGEDGKLFYSYAHMKAGSTDEFGIYAGMKVKKGQHIGKVGNTGNSGGSHLHFCVNYCPEGYYYDKKEIKNGICTNRVCVDFETTRYIGDYIYTDNKKPVISATITNSSSDSITYTGYAYDPDDLGKQVSVKLYCNKDSNGTSVFSTITANKTLAGQPSEAAGHGFSVTIYPSETGNMYAKACAVDSKDSGLSACTLSQSVNIEPKKNDLVISAGSGSFSDGTYIKRLNILTIGSSAGRDLSAYIPSRTGYTFKGYYEGYDSSYNPILTYGPDGKLIKDDGYYWSNGVYVWPYGGEHCVYALWEPNTYRVSFDANGGSGTMSSQSMTYDVSTALNTNKFNKSYATFVEWNTKADGSGVSYNNKESVKNLTAVNNGEVVLYAQWLESAPRSGSCGDNCNWSLDGSTLNITGTGAINNYFTEDAPWKYWESEITNVVIGEGITHIGTMSFSDFSNDLTVTVPSSVVSIGNFAFDGTNVTRINFASLYDYLKIEYSNSNPNNGNNIYVNNAFISGDIVIPEGIEVIPSKAFYKNSLIASVSIPESVNKIMDKAFYECDSLTSFTIGDNVLLSSYALYNCKNITELTLYDLVDLNTGVIDGLSLNTLNVESYRTSIKDLNLNNFKKDGNIINVLYGSKAYYECIELGLNYHIIDPINTYQTVKVVTGDSNIRLSLHEEIIDAYSASYLWYRSTDSSTDGEFVVLEEESEYLNASVEDSVIYRCVAYDKGGNTFTMDYYIEKGGNSDELYYYVEPGSNLRLCLTDNGSQSVDWSHYSVNHVLGGGVVRDLSSSSGSNTIIELDNISWGTYFRCKVYDENRNYLKDRTVYVYVESNLKMNSEEDVYTGIQGEEVTLKCDLDIEEDYRVYWGEYSNSVSSVSYSLSSDKQKTVPIRQADGFSRDYYYLMVMDPYGNKYTKRVVVYGIPYLKVGDNNIKNSTGLDSVNYPSIYFPFVCDETGEYLFKTDGDRTYAIYDSSKRKILDASRVSAFSNRMVCDLNEGELYYLCVNNFLNGNYVSVRVVNRDTCQHINTELTAENPATCTSNGMSSSTICLDCEKVLVEGQILISGHTDNNNDGICDICNEEIVSSSGDIIVNVDEVTDGDVPDGYDSLEQMQDVIIENFVSSYKLRNETATYKLYEIEATTSDGTLIDQDNFPEEGITLVFTYPLGVDKTTKIVVAHVFSYDIGDSSAGDIEYPEITKYDTYFTFTIHGLSPLMFGYESHEHIAATRIENFVEATCARAGSYETVTYCINGNEEISRETVNLGKVEHMSLQVKGTLPTCSDYGLTDGAICQECGELIVEQRQIEKLEHIYDSGEIISVPTCKEKGLISYTCLNCGGIKTVETDLDLNNHAGGFILSNVKEATCFEKGYSGDVLCSDCNENVETGHEIEKFEHQELAYDDIEADCINPGYEGGSYCKKCHEVINERTYVPAKGHTYDEFITIKEANCTEYGQIEYECQVCGDTFNEITDINPDNHTGETYRSYDLKATCEEDGYTGNLYCGNCYKKIEDGELINKLGHQITVFEGFDSTCAYTGLTDEYVCEVCRQKFAGGEAIELKEHHLEKYVHDDGSQYYYCTGCGNVYLDEDLTSFECSTEIYDGILDLKKNKITFKGTVLVGKSEYIQVGEPNDEEPETIICSSDDESVATVNEYGLVTGISEGTTVIKVELNDTVYEVPVTVVCGISDIKLNINRLTLLENEEYTLKATLLPTNISGNNLIWSSSNESVATVNESGLIKAHKAGTALIIVRAADGSKVYASCEVEVSESQQKDNYGSILPEDRPSGNKEIPDGLWISELKDMPYNPDTKEYVQEFRVYNHNQLLMEGVDYSYKFALDKKTNRIVLTVQGKGNYTGSTSSSFGIIPLEMSEESGYYDVLLNNYVFTYNGKTLKPSVSSVTYKGSKLKNNTDYTVEYGNADSTDEGTYTVIIHGKGNYEGTLYRTYTIEDTSNRLPVSKAYISGLVSVYTYTGEKIYQPSLSLSYNGALLTEGVDYSLEYIDNLYPGTATLIIKGLNNYSGTVKKTYKINGLPFNNKTVTVTGFIDVMTYDYDSSLTQNASLYYDGRLLTPSSDGIIGDYTITYKNNTKAGSASVVYKGINGFTGNFTKSYKIEKKLIDESMFTLESDVYAYSKAKVTPLPKTDLVYNRDYTVSYTNNAIVNDNTNPSKITKMVITGKGNYAGKIENAYLFTISEKDLSEVNIISADKLYSSKPNQYKSTPVLTDNGSKLSLGKDYDKNFIYTYEKDTLLEDGTLKLAGEVVGEYDVIPANTLIRVTVNGMGYYTGSTSYVYRIVTADISKASFKIANKKYTGKPVTLDESEITVTLNKVVLSPEDYEIVSYNNNVNKGSATVIVKGKGNYGGYKEVKYNITAFTLNTTIIFDSNGATGTMKSVSYNKTTNLPGNTFKKPGYTFLGWTTDPIEQKIEYTDKQTFTCNFLNAGRTVTLYAVWADCLLKAECINETAVYSEASENSMLRGYIKSGDEFKVYELKTVNGYNWYRIANCF